MKALAHSKVVKLALLLNHTAARLAA